MESFSCLRNSRVCFPLWDLLDGGKPWAIGNDACNEIRMMSILKVHATLTRRNGALYLNAESLESLVFVVKKGETLRTSTPLLVGEWKLKDGDQLAFGYPYLTNVLCLRFDVCKSAAPAAAADQSQLFDRFMELIKCPVCLDQMEQSTVVAICGHLMCVPCRKELQNHPDRLQCPLCRETLFDKHVPNNLIDEMVRDFVQRTPKELRIQASVQIDLLHRTMLGTLTRPISQALIGKGHTW